ncbi:MAG TPA: Uma2 family endonuclease [Tepidisphaeraceae bacterium]|nr:Uma2 family endonuclease [Tepidisphaeraceae bacterium]
MGDRPIRVTFDHGRLEIMSPLPKHEKWKKRIGMLIESLCIELNIPFQPLGSTTFRRDDLEQGLEPDECYYVQHLADIRDKDVLDFPIDPPPDLAVEIDITHRSIKREPIYAGLGVPEIWRFADPKLTVLRLGDNASYKPVDQSHVFPFLPMAQFQAWVLRLGTEDQTPVLREFRDWVKTLKP